MKFYQKKMCGISLLEVMLSLLVIAGIIFVVLRYAGPARQQTQITEAIRQINTLSDASFRWLEGQPSLLGVSIRGLADKGFLPSRYNSTHLDTYDNPWRNEVSIASYGANNQQLAITSQVPTATICNALKARTKKFSTLATCTTESPSTFIVVIGSPS